LIAEQYGELDAAAKIYRRVGKPKFEYPGTSYVLAQQRAAALRNFSNASSEKRALP